MEMIYKGDEPISSEVSPGVFVDAEHGTKADVVDAHVADLEAVGWVKSKHKTAPAADTGDNA